MLRARSGGGESGAMMILRPFLRQKDSGLSWESDLCVTLKEEAGKARVYGVTTGDSQLQNLGRR